jgi:hypothetical protein
MIIHDGTLEFVTARIIFEISRMMKNTKDNTLMFADIRDSEYENPMAATKVINDHIAELAQFTIRISSGDHV